LSERKYSQLFTHESSIFLLKQLYQANRFTDAAQRYRHSLYRLRTDGRKDGRTGKQVNMIFASFTPFTWLI